MQKMKFNVVPKEINMVALIKEINAIACKISIDMTNKTVTVENVADNVIETVINIIDKYYVITFVDIDNIVNDTTQTKNKALVKKQKLYLHLRIIM